MVGFSVLLHSCSHGISGCRRASVGDDEVLTLVAGAYAVVAEGVFFGGGFSLYGVAVVVIDVEDRAALRAARFLQRGVDADAYTALHFDGAGEVVGLRIAVDVGDQEHTTEAGLCEGGPREVGGGAGLLDEIFVLASSGDAMHVPVGFREELDVDGVGWYAVVVDILAGCKEQQCEEDG